MTNPDDQYSEEEAERRAREAIRRSFQTPYTPHKELADKLRQQSQRKRQRSKTPEKPE